MGVWRCPNFKHVAVNKIKRLPFILKEIKFFNVSLALSFCSDWALGVRTITNLKLGNKNKNVVMCCVLNGVLSTLKSHAINRTNTKLILRKLKEKTVAPNIKPYWHYHYNHRNRSNMPRNVHVGFWLPKYFFPFVI